MIVLKILAQINHLFIFITVCKPGLNQKTNVQWLPEATDTKNIVSLLIFEQDNVYYLLIHA